MRLSNYPPGVREVNVPSEAWVTRAMMMREVIAQGRFRPDLGGRRDADGGGRLRGFQGGRVGPEAEANAFLARIGRRPRGLA